VTQLVLSTNEYAERLRPWQVVRVIQLQSPTLSCVQKSQPSVRRSYWRRNS